MAPQLRIRQQKVEPSGDGYKMAETSDPERRSSVNSEDIVVEIQRLVCNLCLKSYSTQRRLDNHKCRVALKNETPEIETEICLDVNYDLKETDPLAIVFRCACCSKVFTRKALLRKHQVKCLGNKSIIIQRKKTKFKFLSKVQKAKFTCTKCNKKFKFEKSFVDHCTLEHSKLPNSLPCKECPARCPTKSALEEHMEKVHKPASFKCPNCDAMFTRNYHVLRHMEQRGCHGGPPAFYQCKICTSKFTRKDNLLHHLRNSHMTHNKRFQCRQCFYGVNNYNKLVKHYMTTHMDNKYVCDYCGKCLSSRVSMAMHLKTHSNKKYLCSICNYETPDGNVINRHMYTHCKNKPFKCDSCPSSFVQRSQLRTHMMAKHTENICETCSEKFPTPHKLAIHMKKHKPDILVSMKVEPRTEVSKFKCEMCTKSFNVAASLQKHMLTHTLDKPRRCMYCARARAYVRSDRLIKHLKDTHPDVFRQHLAAVRSEYYDDEYKETYMSYKVTPDEIDRILEILDEFQDRMLSHGKVLYGGLVQPPQSDDEEHKQDEQASAEQADNPLMLEDELTESLRRLLMQLIDASTLEEFGWPDEDVDVILEKVIEQCGQRPADRDRWSRVQRLRENAKHLFLSVIEDSGMKKMLEMKTIDQVIRHILKVNELDD